MREPYDYQKGVIERSIPRPFTMVQADCGTGKSLMASQTAIGKGKPTLIITPKNVMEDFKLELIADGVPPEDIFMFDVYKSHKDRYYEDFSHWLTAMEYAAHKQTEETESTGDEEIVF